MIFDTHAHYDDEAFDEDREAVLAGLAAKGIGAVTDIGASMESSAQALALAQRYSFMYAAVGVHPSETEGLTEADMEQLKTWCAQPKVVAVGEIGLDYHYPEPARETQQKWFIRQLELAREASLPLVIHSRDAAEDTMRIMRERKAQELGGVIHCYSYSAEMALEYARMGFYIGVGGVLTFPNAKKLVETVQALPLDKIVLETDCPYLSPHPERGVRNDSGKLPFVVRRLAELKGVSEEEVIRVTERSARRLYRLPDC